MTSTPHPTPLKSNSQRLPIIEMVFAAFSFATMAAIAHMLRAEIPWPLLAFVRIFVTFIIALGLARYASQPLVFFGPRVMWIRSVVGSFGLLCTFYAVTHMPITDAVTIQHTSPLWVAIILAVIHRRPPALGVIAAVVIGLCGVALMERPSFESSLFSMGIALLAAFSTACAVVSLRYLGGYSAIAVVAHYCGMASILTFAVCFIPAGGGMVFELGPSAWWMLPMGIAGTCGQIYMTRATGKGDTQLISLVALAVIAFAAFYGYILLGVTLDARKMVGIGLIVAAVVLCSRTRDRGQENNAIKTAPDEG